jgi:hypothetical protein
MSMSCRVRAIASSPEGERRRKGEVGDERKRQREVSDSRKMFQGSDVKSHYC